MDENGRMTLSEGQNRIMAEAMAASAKHLTRNRPIFFKLTLSRRLPASDSPLLDATLRDRLWVLPSRQLGNPNLW